MRKITTLLILGICAMFLQTQAQEIREKTIAFKKASGVYLDLALGNEITVKGWDKNEVYIKTTVEINGGKLNKALEMTYDTWGSKVRVKSSLNNSILRQGKKGDCGNDYKHYSSTMNGRRYYACYEISHEIFMPKNALLKIEAINPKVTLENLTGNLHINTVNGSINMAAGHTKPGQNLEFKTVNGRIDLTMPPNPNTQVEVSTVNGRIYSGFEPKREKRNGMYRIGGNRYNRKVRLTLGNGAASTELSTVNGRIYLRKSK